MVNVLREWGVMNDFLGKPIDICDHVVIVQKGYRDFVIGRVIEFTKSKVRIGYMNTWNGSGDYETTLIYPHQVVKCS